MNKSESINELAMALAKAQGEFGAAKMDKLNPFLKNTYADLGSVIEASKAPCAKYGLSVSQPASTEGDSVTVTTLLMHESGQWISSDMTLHLGEEKGRSIAQAAGSIITYLRRYSLSAILGIYADEDVDGNGAVKQAEKKPAVVPATSDNGHKEIAEPTYDLPDQDVSRWSADLIKHIIDAKVGVKDPTKIPEMLDRSKILTPTAEYRFFDMWINWYCQERKANKNEADAADLADNRLADVKAAQVGG